MQPDYPASFERDTGGTEAEWLGRLAGACGTHPLRIEGQRAHVAIGAGSLALEWTVLPPRQIALMRMPRMRVGFRFDEIDEPTRERFMRYFDLYMQRGGG